MLVWSDRARVAARVLAVHFGHGQRRVGTDDGQVRLDAATEQEDEENPWMKYKLTNTHKHLVSVGENDFGKRRKTGYRQFADSCTHTEQTVLGGVFGVLAVVHLNCGRGCGRAVFWREF